MDFIIRAFWWGHEPGERKLHLLNLDKICRPMTLGGGWLLGLKKFSLIDQAMLVKQFWRISHNPNFLLARTFKAKYFPRGSIQDCTPKPVNLGFEEVSLNLRTPNSKKEDGGLAKAVMFHSIIKIGSKFPLKT